MPTDEPLVPVDVPYGDRQKTKAAMQQAGLPLSQPVNGQQPQGGIAPAGSSPSPSSPAGPLGLLLQNSPDAFPFLADTPPSTAQRPDQPASFTAALAESAQSSFARAVSARLSQIL